MKTTIEKIFSARILALMVAVCATGGAWAAATPTTISINLCQAAESVGKVSTDQTTPLGTFEAATWAEGTSNAVRDNTFTTSISYGGDTHTVTIREVIGIPVDGNHGSDASNYTVDILKSWFATRDNSAHDATLMVAGVPFNYDVVVIMSGSTTSTGGCDGKFAPLTVNGTQYTASDTGTYKTAAGSANWGTRGQSTIEYGTNALRVNGLSGTLTITYNAYGEGIAALQIVERLPRTWTAHDLTAQSLGVGGLIDVPSNMFNNWDATPNSGDDAIISVSEDTNIYINDATTLGTITISAPDATAGNPITVRLIANAAVSVLTATKISVPQYVTLKLETSDASIKTMPLVAPVELASNAKLEIAVPNTFGNAISGTGSLKISADAVRLTHAISMPIEVAANATLDIAGANATYSGVISGAGAVKVSANPVTFSAANTFTGGFTVAAGGNAKTTNNTGFGPAASVLTVENGGSIDVLHTAESAYSYNIAGDGVSGSGALYISANSGDFSNGSKQVGNITLSGNATIKSDHQWGMISGGYAANTLALGTYALTKDGTGSFWLCNTTITGTGTLYVKGGTVATTGTTTTSTCANGIFRVGTGATLKVGHEFASALSVNTLTCDVGSTVTVNNTLTVTGTMTVNGTVTATGTLSPAAISLIRGSVTANTDLSSVISVPEGRSLVTTPGEGSARTYTVSRVAKTSDDAEYYTIAEALTAINDDDSLDKTITLVNDTGESFEIPSVNFVFNTNGKTYTGTVTGASGVAVSESNGVYTGVANTTATWTGTAGGSWSEAANWSTKSVPTSATSVTLPDGAQIAVTGTSAIPVNNLTVNGKVTVTCTGNLGNNWPSIGIDGNADGTGTLKLERVGLKSLGGDAVTVGCNIYFDGKGYDCFVESGSFVFNGSFTGTNQCDLLTTVTFNGAVSIPDGAVLRLGKNGTYPTVSFGESATLTGDGTVVIWSNNYNAQNAAALTGIKTKLQNSNWQGVCELSGSMQNIDFGFFGNSGSVVRPNGLSGYLRASAGSTTEIASNIKALDIGSSGLTFNNQYTSGAPTSYNFAAPLTGSGTIAFGMKHQQTGKAYYTFNGDVSGFTGVVNYGSLDSYRGIVVFKDSRDDAPTATDYGQIIVTAHKEVNVNGTWYGAGGFLIYGKMNLASGANLTCDASGQKICGDGVIRYTFLPASALTFGTWTGTAVIDYAGPSERIDLAGAANKVGKSGSTVEIAEGCTIPGASYFGSDVNPTLKVSGFVSINDGSSGTKRTVPNLTGDGVIVFGTKGAQVNYAVNNVVDWSGVITNSSQYAFVTNLVSGTGRVVYKAQQSGTTTVIGSGFSGEVEYTTSPAKAPVIDANSEATVYLNFNWAGMNIAPFGSTKSTIKLGNLSASNAFFNDGDGNGTGLIPSKVIIAGNVTINNGWTQHPNYTWDAAKTVQFNDFTVDGSFTLESTRTWNSAHCYYYVKSLNGDGAGSITVGKGYSLRIDAVDFAATPSGTGCIVPFAVGSVGTGTATAGELFGPNGVKDEAIPVTVAGDANGKMLFHYAPIGGTEGLYLAVASRTVDVTTTYYATMQDAITAAGDANLASITVIDATAPMPDAYYVNDGTVVKKPAAIVNGESVTYYTSVQNAVNQIVSIEQTHGSYDYIMAYENATVTARTNTLKIKVDAGVSVTVQSPSEEYMMQPGEPVEGVVTYTKLPKATTYTWTGADELDTENEEWDWATPGNWSFVNFSSVETEASRCPQAGDSVIIDMSSATITISANVTVEDMSIEASGIVLAATSAKIFTGSVALATASASLAVDHVTLSTTPTSGVDLMYVKATTSDGTTTYSLQAAGEMDDTTAKITDATAEVTVPVSATAIEAAPAVSSIKLAAGSAIKANDVTVKYNGTTDITGAFSISVAGDQVTLALNANGSVTISDKTITVKPAVDTSDDPMTMPDETTAPSFNIKTIPGLYYVVRSGTSPSSLTAGSATQATTTTTGLAGPALGNEDTVRYYKISVGRTAAEAAQ